MKQHKVASTLIQKRIYQAPIELIWRAWTDPTEAAKWRVGGWDYLVHFAEADVRVGGNYRVAFAPPGQTHWIETGKYTEVIPLKHLVYEETVTHKDQLVHSNQTRSTSAIWAGRRGDSHHFRFRKQAEPRGMGPGTRETRYRSNLNRIWPPRGKEWHRAGLIATTGIAQQVSSTLCPGTA